MQNGRALKSHLRQEPPRSRVGRLGVRRVMEPGTERAPLLAQRHFLSSKTPCISANKPRPACGVARASVVYSEGGLSCARTEWQPCHPSEAPLWLTRCFTVPWPAISSTPLVSGHSSGGRGCAGSVWQAIHICLRCQERPRDS